MTMAEQMARAMDPECFEPEVERTYGDLWAFAKQARMRRLALAALKAQRQAIEQLKQPTIHYAVMKQMLDAAILEAKGEEIQ